MTATAPIPDQAGGNAPASPAAQVAPPHLLRLVAFEGPVEFARWAETSGNGRRIWFTLANREALLHFDKATKRRGGKGGQRYRMFISDTDGVILEGFPDDAWFIGATWSHTKGAAITLEVAEFGAFQQNPTTDSSAVGKGAEFYLTLLELDDNEQPVDQAQADRADELAARLKGGPKSKQAAILFQSEDFRRFVALRLYGQAGAVGDRRYATPQQADEWAKKVGGFTSKVQLDHDQAAAERYQHKVMRWFLSWARQQ